jgi:two-component system probable response regulator PhcQ
MKLEQTVLLVDDDPHLLAGLRRALRSEPYEVVLAETAGAALNLLATTSVDVLVTDQRMPGMSGAEFLTTVRAEYPHVISIMLTGHADLATAISAINSGEVYRFFTKPCDAGSLADAIRQALQLKALIRQTRRLLDTVRRQTVELTPRGATGDAAYVEEATRVLVFEADASPVDLDALLREIHEELDAAERRTAGAESPRSAPR